LEGEVNGVTLATDIWLIFWLIIDNIIGTPSSEPKYVKEGWARRERVSGNQGTCSADDAE
jgi:hypothetical protein